MIFLIIVIKTLICGYTLELPMQGSSYKYPQSMFWIKNKNQMTKGPVTVNAHLIWTALLVGELMTPALGCGLYGPQDYRWKD